MANYSLVVDAKFRPFSYQELLAPALMMTQAHQQLEDQYAELSSKANIWDKMANEQTDKKAHAIYKQYANDLRDKANQLSSYGLDPQSRQELLGMRSRYSSEIVPIEQAYKKREEQAIEQRQAMLQNPTLLLSRKASTTSLDDYLDNPNLDYQSYSGALLTQQASQMAQQLAKELSSTNVGRVDSYTNLLKNKYGLTKSDIMEAAINPNSSKATKALNAIRTEVLKASRIPNWGDEQTLKAADSYIKQGWWSAIGPEQAQMFENKGAVLAAQFAHDKEMEDLRVKHQKELAAPPQNKFKVNPLPLRSAQEVSNSRSQLDGFIKDGYLVKTPRGLQITRQGMGALKAAHPHPLMPSWEQYKKTHPGASRSSYEDTKAEVTRVATVPSNFASWYESKIGGFNATTGKVETPTIRLNKYNHTVSTESYDVYHSTEYDRQLSSEYGAAYTKQMWSSAASKDGEKHLQGVEFNGKSGWKNTKEYSKEDLEGYSVTNVRHSKWGDTAILQSDKDGKNDVIRVLIPKGINIGSEADVKRAITNADYWGAILYEGRRPMINSSGQPLTDSSGNIKYSNVPLSDADRIVLEKRQNEKLQDIYGYGSQAVVPSETTNEKIEPWY